MPVLPSALKLCLVTSVALVGVSSVLMLVPSSAKATTSPSNADTAKTYIVQWRQDDVSAQAAGAFLQQLQIRPRHVYRHALSGFAAALSPAQVRQLRQNPQVAGVYEDGRVFINTQTRSVLAAGKPKNLRKKQTLPTGIARCGALRSPTADIDGVEQALDVDVAVLDTGIDPRHPDLNVVGGVSVIKGSYADKNGHGTHVAGIIGARDNGFGVVGVAPGARLWSVRVLNARGVGSISDVIAGLDWIAERADVIDVVNMSFFGALQNPGPLRQAVGRCVEAGVTAVAAAGNSLPPDEPKDVQVISPAGFPSVLAVSALADRNGEAGPSAGRFKIMGKWWEVDEDFGSFSNYGASVALVAPGAKILSTLRGGKYGELTGTSQAAPHVAGAAALYKVRHPEATPQQIRAALTSVGADFPPAAAHDGMAEPALDVSSL